MMHMEHGTMKLEEAMKVVEHGMAALNKALQAGHSETLKEFLATMARFHNYSFGNAMLIGTQKPEATHVAGFHTWKKLGRSVKKGEHGIAILAPMASRKDRERTESDCRDDDTSRIFGFKVAYVFDVTQTEGEPLPEFANTTGDPGDWLVHLEESIREAGVILEYDHIPGGAKGVSVKGKITVRPDMPANETFAVLAHELAHELMHKEYERRSETTPQIRETEAEAVAYTVCLACGMDSTTRSADYIQLYRGNEETLRESLTFVRETAARIITTLRSKHEQPASMPAVTLSA